MFKVKLWVFLLVGISFQTVYADDAVNSAMLQTQDCLKNKACDAAKTKAGQEAIQKALAAVGGNAASQQELFNISADIMPFLVQQTGGDSAKMQKAQNDPQGFFNSLPAEMQTKIKNIASTVEKTKAK